MRIIILSISELLHPVAPSAFVPFVLVVAIWFLSRKRRLASNSSSIGGSKNENVNHEAHAVGVAIVVQLLLRIVVVMPAGCRKKINLECQPTTSRKDRRMEP